MLFDVVVRSKKKLVSHKHFVIMIMQYCTVKSACYNHSHEIDRAGSVNDVSNSRCAGCCRLEKGCVSNPRDLRKERGEHASEGSAHRCLLGHWTRGGRHTCLYTCSPAPVTFGHNDIPSACLSVNAVACNTALPTHIIAMSGARHVQRVIVAEGI